jgi:hypothetical protein
MGPTGKPGRGSVSAGLLPQPVQRRALADAIAVAEPDLLAPLLRLVTSLQACGRVS